MCYYFQGVITSKVLLLPRCYYFQGVITSKVLLLPRCYYFQDVIILVLSLLDKYILELYMYTLIFNDQHHSSTYKHSILTFIQMYSHTTELCFVHWQSSRYHNLAFFANTFLICLNY